MSHVAGAPSIDHIVLATRDLAATRQAFARLGFVTAPIARHPWGTWNSVVQLRDCYIELLGVGEPDKIGAHGPGRFDFGAFNRDFLARREGMSMLALRSADAAATGAAFAAAGLGGYAPFAFSRPAVAPDGGAATLNFALAFANAPALGAEAALFACAHGHPPELFWKPEAQSHPNRAQTLAEVAMVAADPAPVAAAVAAAAAAAAAAGAAAGASPDLETAGDPVGVGDFAKAGDLAEAGDLVGAGAIPAGAARVRVTTPAAFARAWPGAALRDVGGAPHFAAITLRVADLDACAAAIGRAGGRCRRDGDRLSVSPEAAGNLALAFTEAR